MPFWSVRVFDDRFDLWHHMRRPSNGQQQLWQVRGRLYEWAALLRWHLCLRCDLLYGGVLQRIDLLGLCGTDYLDLWCFRSGVRRVRGREELSIRSVQLQCRTDFVR